MNINKKLRARALTSFDKFKEELRVKKKSIPIPFNKVILRETLRIVGQISNLKNAKNSVYFIQNKLKTSMKKISKKNINHPLINRSHHVILVIYQPNGISDSWFNTIKELEAMDVALHIFSNGYLNPKDEKKITEFKKIKLTKRANYGFDFGAYREGILEIINFKNIQKITLINDSIFFPITGDVKDIFDLFEKNEGDFIGLVENSDSSRESDFHLGSFFLQFNKNIIENPFFESYWRKLRISNSKYKTVLFGEKGLSQKIQKLGYNYSVIYDYKDLLIKLSNMEPHQLLPVMKDIVLVSYPEWRTLQREYRDHLISEFRDTKEWKKLSLEWMDHAMRYFNKTHSCAILYPKLLGMPLIKKDLMHYYGDGTWQKIVKKVAPLSKIDLL